VFGEMSDSVEALLSGAWADVWTVQRRLERRLVRIKIVRVFIILSYKPSYLIVPVQVIVKLGETVQIQYNSAFLPGSPNGTNRHSKP
jgi:hypothetical protein